MKQVFCSLFTILLLTTMAQAGEKNNEDPKLRAFFKDFLEKEFKLQPLKATYLGDHRFDHLLEDVSPEARAKWVKLYRHTLQELPKQISYDKLSRDSQIDFEILKHYLKFELWLAKNTKPFEEDPRVYNNYISDSIYLLFTQSTLPKAVNVRNAVKRIAHIPKIIEVAKRTIKNPPKVKVETAIKQTRGAISFYESGIFQLAGETPALSKLKEGTKPVVKSLRGYLKFLQTKVIPEAKGDWRLGKKKFAEKFLLQLDAGITADQVLKDAEAEFDRVINEMYVISRQLWSKYFPKEPLPVADAEGKQLTIRKVLDEVSKDHGKAENLVRDARADVVRIKKFIENKDILHLPKPDRCQIIEMPEFQRGNSIAYLNPAPPLDPKSSSYYAISPPPSSWTPRRQKTFMEEYNKYILQMLSIHEAYPGHYVQLEYSNRHPSFIS